MVKGLSFIFHIKLTPGCIHCKFFFNIYINLSNLSKNDWNITAVLSEHIFLSTPEKLKTVLLHPYLRLPDKSWVSVWEIHKLCNQITKIFSRQSSIFWTTSHVIFIIKRTILSFITTNSNGAHNQIKELANLKKQNLNNPLKQNTKIQQQN